MKVYSSGCVCVPELQVWPFVCCSKDTCVFPGRAVGAAPHLAPSLALRPSSPSNSQNQRRRTSPWHHHDAASALSLVLFLASLQMEVRASTFSPFMSFSPDYVFIGSFEIAITVCLNWQWSRLSFWPCLFFCISKQQSFIIWTFPSRMTSGFMHRF